MKCFFTISVFLILGSPNDAAACGSCAYVLFDRILPPIMGWVLLSVLWSFSLSVYSAVAKSKIWGVHRPLGWIILVFILFITSISFTGPIVFLFLILPGVVLSFKVFISNRSIYRRKKRNLRIISTVGIACLTGMIITTAIMRHVRTDADFILKYEYSYLAKTALNELLNQRSSKLNELREIVRRGKNSRIIAMAGENIAAYGDSTRDFPLLLEAYARIYGNYEDENVEKALSKMTGIILPEGSPPEEWRKHWNLNAKIQIQPILNEKGK